MSRIHYESPAWKQPRAGRNRVINRPMRIAVVGVIAWTVATAALLGALAMVAGGCRAILPTPTTQQITAPAIAVAASAAGTVTRVEALTPYVQSNGSTSLASAVASARQTVTLADRAVASSAEFSAMVDRLAEQQAGAARKLTAAIADRDAKILSQRREIVGWESSWFGGRFWSALRWITGIGAILVVGSLILNAKTDVFVYAAIPLRWLFDAVCLAITGAVKAVAQLFGYRGTTTSHDAGNK